MFSGYTHIRNWKRITHHPEYVHDKILKWKFFGIYERSFCYCHIFDIKVLDQ